jgi:hypothetical protein
MKERCSAILYAAGYVTVKNCLRQFLTSLEPEDARARGVELLTMVQIPPRRGA